MQCVHSIYIPNKVCGREPGPTLSSSAPQHLLVCGPGERKPSSRPCSVPAAPGDPLSPATTQVLILADGDPSSFLSRQLPFLSTLRRLEDRATAYVCENQACSMPITEPSELRKLLHH